MTRGTLRLAVFLMGTSLFITSQSADAAEIIFTIDKDLSSVTWSGLDNDAGPLAAQPQDSTSNVASFNGHFALDFNPFGPTTVEFVLGHGFMNYGTKPLLSPNLGPGSIGMSSSDNTVQYKYTDLAWDFASVPAGTVTPGPVPLVNNSISATETAFRLIRGVEHISHPSGSRSKDFAGFADIFSAGTWTLEESAPGSGLWTLTASGISYTNTYDIGAGALGTLDVSGTLVAHAVYGAQSIDVVDDFDTVGSVLGGASAPGGVDIAFTDVTTTGSLAVQQIDTDGLSVAALAELSSVANFKTAGDTPQIWDVSFSGTYDGPLTLTFGYDPSLLGGVAETDLFVWHFDEGLNKWEQISGTVDTDLNTITISAGSLSPFALGVPEPSSFVLAGMAAACAAGMLCRRRHPQYPRLDSNQ